LGYGMVIYFLGQSSLTFSRTGVWIGCSSIFVAAFLLMRGNAKARTLLAAMFVVCLAGYFVVYPLLDRFTGGKLSERFSETGFSGREKIANGDLQLAMEHPMMGVGLGMAQRVRSQQLGVGGAAHTEFTRLLAEHGALGLVAMAMLLGIAFLAWRNAKTPIHQAWTGAWVLYSLLFMCVTGMRLGIPALTFGLALIKPLSYRRSRSSERDPMLSARRTC
jgi:hypothetical protein